MVCLFLDQNSSLKLFICSGIVLLDLDEQTLEGIYEAIINDAVANGQMNKDAKDELLRILTSEHRYLIDSFSKEEIFSFRHPEPRSSFRRRSSAIDVPQTNTRRSSLAFRKNEQINVDNTRRLSLLELKANGDSVKTLKSLVVKVCSNFLLLLKNLNVIF